MAVGIFYYYVAVNGVGFMDAVRIMRYPDLWHGKLLRFIVIFALVRKTQNLAVAHKNMKRFLIQIYVHGITFLGSLAFGPRNARLPALDHPSLPTYEHDGRSVRLAAIVNAQFPCPDMYLPVGQYDMTEFSVQDSLNEQSSVPVCVQQFKIRPWLFQFHCFKLFLTAR